MTRLLAIVCTEGLGLWLAHRLSAPHRAQIGVEWAAAASLPELLVALLHLFAWVATWWLLAGTLHDVVLTAIELRRDASSSPTPARRARRIAPPWVQRVVNQAMGTLLVLGVMAGPAAAGTQGTPVVASQQVVTPPVPILGGAQSEPVQSEPAQSETAPPETEPADMTPGNAGQGDSVMPTEEALDSSPETISQHTVAAGENVWVIARAELHADGQAPPTDREVHAYWLRLIEANTFDSGSPDVIQPGEVLDLPDMTTTPTDTLTKAPVASSL